MGWDMYSYVNINQIVLNYTLLLFWQYLFPGLHETKMQARVWDNTVKRWNSEPTSLMYKLPMNAQLGHVTTVVTGENTADNTENYNHHSN